jgi:hypothetical protein
MKLLRLAPRSIGMICIILGLAVSMPAQKMIGAKAGIIDCVVGQSFLDDKPLRMSKEDHLQLENGQVLSTRHGRVELLLAVNAYLRLDENSSLLMENNSLNGAQVAIIRGAALIEVAEKIKAKPINVRVLSSVVKIQKAGLYKVDSDRCDLRVYEGAVTVSQENKRISVRKSGSLRLDGNLTPLKIDMSVIDPLYVWSGYRSFSLFISNPSNKKMPNWKLTAKGDLKNTNYRLSFRTNAAWVRNWRIQEMQNELDAQERQERNISDQIEQALEPIRRIEEEEAAKQADQEQ